MRPAAIASIVNEIDLRMRRCLVELGAGTSTIFLGHALRAVGGRLVSVEHDPDFARYLDRLVSREGLADTVRIEVVDLVPLPPAALPKGVGPEWLAPTQWYDLDRLRDVCPDGIDGLVVDGPPAGGQDRVLVRVPAVAALRSRLASDFSLFLDDVDRPAERETARQWSLELGIDIVIVERIALAVGVSHGGFAPTL